MRSSIFSSDAPSGRRWQGAWLIAALLAASICTGLEAHWRALGYRPQLQDSAQLWSMQRARVDTSRRIPLVVLGASHIQYALDMKLLAQRLPDYRPIMLADNGRYPLAALRDLAADEDFRGIVLCDIDARGLSSYYDDMQQPAVEYFHKQWSPNWYAHRKALNLWQRTAVIAWSRFGALATLERWIDAGSAPWRSPTTLRTDRSGDIDFSAADGAALARGFLDGLRADLHRHPPQSPALWRANLERVRRWCDRIHSRGGQVVFLRTPTSGALAAAEEAAYPRSRYWDRLADAVGVPVVYAADIPFFANLTLHDGSHVDYHDKPAYTRALVDLLQSRGWVRR